MFDLREFALVFVFFPYILIKMTFAVTYPLFSIKSIHATIIYEYAIRMEWKGGEFTKHISCTV